ncbi:MAG: UDP-N-acetylmuramoyl-tripeptide--D-alanyl-D-alanine ligase [Chitinophagales bacterium]
MKIEELYLLYKQCTGITTDTRNVKKGCMFFALKGEKFNGNLFASDALKSGAKYVIVDEQIQHFGYELEQVVVVDDVLKTMQQLGLYHRQQVGCKVIALTGSNGKTTTKELMAAVLSTTFKTHFTKGNLNNHIGIPLTLLEMPADTEIAVIEMGANHQLEIKGYCDYVEPDYGLITNVGKAHLEGFGGEEGVVKGKTELYEYIGRKGGVLFVNDRSEKLIERAFAFSVADKIVFYGGKRDAFVSGTIVRKNECLNIELSDGVNVQTQLVGDYNFDNAMAAIGVGKYFGIEEEVMVKALQEYVPSNNRSQKIVVGTNTIILDAYNANPSSMQEALKNFELLDAKNKMVVLGEMMELGEFSAEEHQRIADIVLQMNLTERVFVGKQFAFLKDNPSVLYFENVAQLKEWYSHQNFHSTTQLIKGSRSNALEGLLK